MGVWPTLRIWLHCRGFKIENKIRGRGGVPLGNFLMEQLSFWNSLINWNKNQEFSGTSITGACQPWTNIRFVFICLKFFDCVGGQNIILKPINAVSDSVSWNAKLISWLETVLIRISNTLYHRDDVRLLSLRWRAFLSSWLCLALVMRFLGVIIGRGALTCQIFFDRSELLNNVFLEVCTFSTAQ